MLIPQIISLINYDYIILATTCGKDILVNKSQPSCNIIVHNTNIFLSTLSLELLPFLMDIHPYFYDLVEIWLEGIFQERIHKFFNMNSLVLDVYKVFKFSSHSFKSIFILLSLGKVF